MFHVMLALPVLTAFGAMGTVILMLMFLLLGAAFFGVMLINLLFRTLRWLLWLPLLVGVIGLILCLMAPMPLAASVILVFWGLYAVVCLLGWAVSAIIRAIWLWIVR